MYFFFRGPPFAPDGFGRENGKSICDFVRAVQSLDQRTAYQAAILPRMAHPGRKLDPPEAGPAAATDDIARPHGPDDAPVPHRAPAPENFENERSRLD